MGLADSCQIGTQASKKMTFGLSALPGSSYSNRGPKTEFIHKNASKMLSGRGLRGSGSIFYVQMRGQSLAAFSRAVFQLR
jgi:hypothetical protein